MIIFSLLPTGSTRPSGSRSPAADGSGEGEAVMRGSCGARPHARGCGTNPCSARCLRHPTPGKGRERRIFARLLAEGPRCPGSGGLKKQRAPRMAPLRLGHLGAPWALWCARAPPVFGDAFWKPLTRWLSQRPDKIQQKKPFITAVSWLRHLPVPLKPGLSPLRQGIWR